MAQSSEVFNFYILMTTTKSDNLRLFGVHLDHTVKVLWFFFMSVKS